MNSTLIIIVAFSGYWLAALMQAATLYGKARPGRALTLGTAVIAVACHGFALYQWIDGGSGQNLTYVNVLSQTGWLVAVLLLLSSVKKPTDNLGIFVYPLTALTIPLVVLFPGQHIIEAGASPSFLFHIGIALLTFSVVSVAALQALLVSIQERRLRVKPTSGFFQALPSLESMESLLLQLIIVGFVLLTLMLATSFFTFDDLFATKVLQKFVLALLAWVVFAVLLFGRMAFGWRGQVISKWTLSGTGLLTLSYFGSRLLLM